MNVPALFAKNVTFDSVTALPPNKSNPPPLVSAVLDTIVLSSRLASDLSITPAPPFTEAEFEIKLMSKSFVMLQGKVEMGLLNAD